MSMLGVEELKLSLEARALEHWPQTDNIVPLLHMPLYDKLAFTACITFMNRRDVIISALKFYRGLKFIFQLNYILCKPDKNGR